ncbi:MAG TPA: carbon-nitrogen hydrolase family protein [Armatimonadota bacterium]|nr:carbon-nitrogen hydrolase family protein [Armatimonadota bacterium]
MGRLVTIAALQPLGATDRVVYRHRHDPAARNRHFLRYNIGASTYDEAYCRAYGEEYLRYLEGWIARAAARGVQFLLLPEVAFEPGVLAAPGEGVPPNPTMMEDAVRLYTWSEARFLERVGALCRATGLYVGVSLPDARDGRLYNYGLILDDRGAVILRYAKVHLAPGPEEDYFTAGTAYPVCATPLGRYAFNICYDIQFPEAAACCEEAGAEILLHPSNGYTLPDEERDMGQNRLRVRASDHHCAVVFSSYAPGRRHALGHSQVIARNGTVLAELRGKSAGLAVGVIEIDCKRQWPGDGPDAPDRRQFVRRRRRPETYGALVRRTDRSTH